MTQRERYDAILRAMDDYFAHSNEDPRNIMEMLTYAYNPQRVSLLRRRLQMVAYPDWVPE